MRRTVLPILLIGILIAAGLCSLLFILIRPSAHTALKAEIYVDGEIVRTLDLSGIEETRTIRIETPYGYNLVEAGPGYIRMQDADCPHRTCTHMGKRTGDGIPIVCLPHHLVIRVCGSEPEEDGVTY